jgi:transposase
MLASDPTTTKLPFPIAAVALTPQARLALLPARLLRPWLCAALLESALARVDLACLYPLYRQRGSLPFHPRLMLLLALFCIADGLPSPADWALMANRDGPTRWLLWGIEPSPSACYAFRDRLGVDVLLELNRQVLALARQDRLTPANRAAIDGTLQEAHASRHHLVNQSRIEQGLLALAEPVAPADDSAVHPSASPSPDSPGLVAATTQQQPLQSSTLSDPAAKQTRRPVRPGHTAAGRARQRQRWLRAQQQMQQRQARNQQKRKSKQTDPKKILISPTDSEAALGRDKRGVFRPLYNAQLAADLDSELILGYEVFAQPNDNGLLPIMLECCERLLGQRLDLSLVDAGYTGGQELTKAEQAGVEVLGPCAGQGETSKEADSPTAKSAFRYEQERDEYICPQGKTLRCVGQSRQKRSSVELVVLKEYRCTAEHCQNCPRKQECCPKSQRGRSISRSEHEGAIERLRQRMSEPENKKKYKRRAASVERLFGDGKEQRGMQRVSGRGLNAARIQLGLTVLQHNLRVLGRAMQLAHTQKDAPPSLRQSA